MAITKIEVPELFDFGSDNSAFKLPTGTTAERPTSPSNGEMRFNTTTGYVEYYDTTDTQWWEIDYAPDPLVPSENFNAVLYTGDGTTGRVITTGLAADLVIIKNRSSSQQDWIWFDSVRGVSEYIRSNSTSQQYNAGSGQGVSAFGSTTVTIGDNAAGNLGANGSVGGTYSGAALQVMYSFKAGGSSNTFNKNGTGYGTASAAGLTGESNITIQGSSVNTESGISIIKTLTGPSTGMIIPHGLGTQPELIISKPLNISLGWYTWTPILDNGSTSSNTGWKGLFLNTNAAASSSAYVYASNTHIYDSWAVGREVVYYSFISIAGYSKIGSYTGNGSATGPIVTLGFEPAWVMIKRTDSSANWRILDNKRSTTNPINKELYPNLSNAEGTFSALDFLSNGFQIINTDSSYNASGGTYLYMAFAT